LKYSDIYCSVLNYTDYSDIEENKDFLLASRDVGWPITNLGRWIEHETPGTGEAIRHPIVAGVVAAAAFRIRIAAAWSWAGEIAG